MEDESEAGKLAVDTGACNGARDAVQAGMEEKVADDSCPMPPPPLMMTKSDDRPFCDSPINSGICVAL
jgi:hypothetical protein